MLAHAVTLEVELRKGDDAVRMATEAQAAAIPSRPRRARHLIEVARGHHLKHEHGATLMLLNRAHDSAPETPPLGWDKAEDAHEPAATHHGHAYKISSLACSR